MDFEISTRNTKSLLVYDIVWLTMASALIAVPVFFHVAGACVVSQTAIEYAACSVAATLIEGICIMLGVILALLYCKRKNVQSVVVYLLLQMAGIVGVLGLRNVSAAAGVLYSLILVSIYAYNNPKGKSVQASPAFTFVLWSLLFYASFAERRSGVALWWREVFPHHGAGEFFLYAGLTSSLITQAVYWVWVKSRSVVGAGLTAACLLAAALYVAIRLAFRYTLNF